MRTFEILRKSDKDENGLMVIDLVIKDGDYPIETSIYNNNPLDKDGKKVFSSVPVGIVSDANLNKFIQEYSDGLHPINFTDDATV